MTMNEFDEMTRDEREAKARAIELEWHLNRVPGLDAPRFRDVVVVGGSSELFNDDPYRPVWGN
jgi:hypothetical protein